jgi:eukaryotic-like serine/threonine-protein kinase
MYVHSQRWARLEPLFFRAIAQPRATRDAFLERNCGGDADLRRELDELLRSHDAVGFMDTALPTAESITLQPSFAAGTSLGCWRIEQIIGRGGMGEVYAATRADAAFEQRAALKLLRFEAAAQTDRFHSERRILALLEHPGIARLLDGGTAPDGRPYTVMEFVEGRSLTDYCHARSSSLLERLTLFMQVCNAVAFAHRNLVIHRDLKPDNILVDSAGTVKLLDFGIAKLLDAVGSQHASQTTIAPFTPDYAAPEQISGQPISTATDIYSLGVLLFELLTGERPLQKRGLPSTQAMQLLLDRDAPAPSRIAQSKSAAPVSARLMAGDLDAIIAKCLRKEPAHRYETVNALKRDIQAHLDNEPVQAREGARMYVFGRALRRHRWVVVGIGVLIVTLTAGLAGTLWQAEQAQMQAERANTVRDFLVTLFGTAEADKPRDLKPTLEDIIARGANSIQTDSEMPLKTRADLLGVLSRVALRMGTEAQKNQLTEALLPLSEQVYGKTDPGWYSARLLRASALYDSGRYAEAAALLEPMRDVLLQRGDPPAFELLQVLVHAMSDQGGRTDEALALQREMRVMAMRDAHVHPRSTLKVLIAEANMVLGLNHSKEGLALGESALVFWGLQHLPEDEELLWLYSTIGNAAGLQGDTARGEAAFREAIALSQRLHQRPHPDTAWFVGLLGSYLLSLGRLDEAEPFVSEGLNMRRDLLGAAHPATLYAISVLARLRAAQNRTDDALAVLTEGATVCARNQLRHFACVRVLNIRCQMHALRSEFDAAEADLDAAMALQRQISGEDSLAMTEQLYHLSELQRARGRFDESIATADRAIAIFDRTGGGRPGDVPIMRLQRAWANLERGSFQAALDEISEAEAIFSAQFPGELSLRGKMLSVRARALSQLNRDVEAGQTATKALALFGDQHAAEATLIAELKRLAARGAGE